MNLLLRFDADGRIGFGHAMRCLALAQECAQQGGRVDVASAGLAPLARKAYADLGARFHDIAGAPGGEQDAGDLARICDAVQPHWLLLDGYAFTPGYLRRFEGGAANVLCIDDHGHLPVYNVDAVCNHNPIEVGGAYAGRLRGAELLAGPAYTMLRRELRPFRPREARPPARVQRLLLTLGGSDARAEAARILACLSRAAPGRSLDVDVILGQGQDPGNLAAMVGSGPHRVVFSAAVEDLPARLARSDLVIAAAGFTLVEAVYLGRPVLAGILADNQVPLASFLARRGVIRLAGWWKDASEERVTALLTEAVERPGDFAPLLARGLELLDGRGQERLLAALKRLWLGLRPAQPEDSGRLFAWVNDPANRAASFSGGPVARDTHEAWFAARLADPGCRIYLGQGLDGTVLGQVRFERDQSGAALVDVHVDAACRGAGVGRRLIRRGTARFFRESGASLARALVKTANLASRRAFAAAGYRSLGPGSRGGQAFEEYVMHPSWAGEQGGAA